MSKSIRRERTAIKRKKPSAPVIWAYENGNIDSVVFDWGCGKGKDSEYLTKEGFEVISYDPFFDDTNPPDCLDFEYINTILLIYVMNIIEDIDERNDLIFDIGSISNEGTNVIIAVPRNKTIEYRANKSGWEEYEDGYITKNNTFQKGYTLVELAEECVKIGNIRYIEKLSGSLVALVNVS